MENPTLINELRKQALGAIDAGDPEKAEPILEAAHVLVNDDHAKRVLYKALEQVQVGTLQEAENILELLWA
jgi:hypothetical protein